MRPLWCLPLVSGLALAACASFPWSEGYLDAGQTAAFPLVFWSRSPTPRPEGTSAPRTVSAKVIWSATPLPPVRAVLTPGLPAPLGRDWQAPVALTLNVTAPAVVEVLGQPVAVHPGLTVPAVQVGQAFLRVDLNAVYRQGGRVLTVPELAGRVLTLKRLDTTTATFTVGGLGEVQRDGETNTDFPDLAPLIDDPELAGLKRAYESQQVWGYGGLQAACFPSPQAQVGVAVPRTQGVRVRRVARLGKTMQLNVQGGYDGGAGQGACGGAHAVPRERGHLPARGGRGAAISGAPGRAVGGRELGEDSPVLRRFRRQASRLQPAPSLPLQESATS